MILKNKIPYFNLALVSFLFVLAFILKTVEAQENQGSEEDFTNEDDIFHKNHKEHHKCNLNKDGRVIRKYRKSISVKEKNYICEEIDSNFLSEFANVK